MLFRRILGKKACVEIIFWTKKIWTLGQHIIKNFVLSLCSSAEGLKILSTKFAFFAEWSSKIGLFWRLLGLKPCVEKIFWTKKNWTLSQRIIKNFVLVWKSWKFYQQNLLFSQNGALKLAYFNGFWAKNLLLRKFYEQRKIKH